MYRKDGWIHGKFQFDAFDAGHPLNLTTFVTRAAQPVLATNFKASRFSCLTKNGASLPRTKVNNGYWGNEVKDGQQLKEEFLLAWQDISSFIQGKLDSLIPCRPTGKLHFWVLFSHNILCKISALFQLIVKPWINLVFLGNLQVHANYFL